MRFTNGLSVTRKSVHRPIGLSVFSPNGLSVNSTVSQIIHDMNNLCEFAIGLSVFPPGKSNNS